MRESAGCGLHSSGINHKHNLVSFSIGSLWVPGSGSMFVIKIKMDNGKVIIADMVPSDTVATFRKRTQDIEGITLGRIRFNGTVVPDHWTADEVTSLLSLLFTTHKEDAVVTAESKAAELIEGNGTSRRSRSRSRNGGKG